MNWRSVICAHFRIRNRRLWIHLNSVNPVDPMKRNQNRSSKLLFRRFLEEFQAHSDLCRFLLSVCNQLAGLRLWIAYISGHLQYFRAALVYSYYLNSCAGVPGNLQDPHYTLNNSGIIIRRIKCSQTIISYLHHRHFLTIYQRTDTNTSAPHSSNVARCFAPPHSKLICIVWKQGRNNLYRRQYRK